MQPQKAVLYQLGVACIWYRRESGEAASITTGRLLLFDLCPSLRMICAVKVAALTKPESGRGHSETIDDRRLSSNIRQFSAWFS